MALTAFASHRPACAIGPFRRFPPIAFVSPRIPCALYFPHGRRADSCVGPAWGKSGSKSWRGHRRCLPKGQFSVVLSGAIILPWMDPPVGGWRGALLPAFSVSRTAGVLLLVLIDRARGGLAANWPPRKSAIWNHLRTAAADSLPAKGATANGQKHSAAIRGSHAPPSQDYRPRVLYAESSRVV